MLTRRQFLARAAQFGTAMSVLGGPLSKARAAAESSLLQRRHLIHIHLRGGWDSLWFHNGVLQSEIGSAATACGAVYDPNDATLNLERHGATLGLCTDDPGQPKRWHLRYRDADCSRMPDGSVLGPGMSMFTEADKRDLLILRGIDPQGGHGVANEIYNFGSTASAGHPGFGTLIAQELADTIGARPLHHVAAGGYLSVTGDGDATGAARMIPIANFASLSALTTPQRQHVGGDRKTILRDAASRLATLAANGYARQRGKDLVNAYAGAYRNLNDLLDGGLANRTDPLSFRATWKAYYDGMIAVMNDHLFVRELFPKQYGLTEDGRLSEMLAPTLFAPNFLSDPVSQPIAVTQLTEFAFKIALADYLVTNNLSAVVQLEDACGDCHGSQSTQTIVMLAFYAGLQMLMTRLRAQGLMEHTSIVMMSEFDRAPLLGAEEPGYISDPGTTHWVTGSMLFAGRGFTTGKRFGDFNKSDGISASVANDQGHLAGLAPFSEVAPYEAVPIDVNTGAYKRRSEGGSQIIGPQIFPTLLSAFSASNRVKINLAPPVSALLAP